MERAAAPERAAIVEAAVRDTLIRRRRPHWRRGSIVAASPGRSPPWRTSSYRPASFRGRCRSAARTDAHGANWGADHGAPAWRVRPEARADDLRDAANAGGYRRHAVRTKLRGLARRRASRPRP